MILDELDGVPGTESTQQKLQQAVCALDDWLNGGDTAGHKMGFALVLFQFDERNGMSDYVTNTENIEQLAEIFEALAERVGGEALLRKILRAGRGSA